MVLRFLKRQQTQSLAPAPRPSQQQFIAQYLCPRGFPAVAENARLLYEICTSPDPSVEDILPILEADESLTARVIKIANSAYFNRGVAVGDVTAATSMIGISELSTILSCSTLKESFKSRSPLRANLWKHNLAVAIISKTLSQHLSISSPGFCFTAGLLHDIGKLLMIQKAESEMKRVLQRVMQSGKPFWMEEEQVFPFTHTEVGALLAVNWKFSTEMCGLISSHHLRWEKIPTSHPEILIVKFADLYVHSKAIGHPQKLTKLIEENQEELDRGYSMLNIAPSSLNTIIDKALETQMQVYE